MNICFLIRTFQYYRGGIETYTATMAKALSQQRHKVIIITRASANQNFYLEPLGENIEVYPIDFKDDPFKGYWILDQWLPLTELRYGRCVFQKLNEITKKTKIDLVEAPSVADAFWLSLRKKYPLHYRLHGNSALADDYFNKRAHIDLRKKLLWHMERFIIRRANSVSAVSTDFSILVRKIWKSNHRPIKVISNYINVALHHPPMVERRETAVVFAARLENNKGIGVLIEAMSDVIHKMPQVHFYFAGRASRDHWITLLKSKFSAKNFTLLGQLSAETLVSYLQKSQICVIPSRYEAGGISAMEAMACGCAVVASDVGGLKETIINGKDGLLVPAGDAKALGNAIIKILEDAVLRKKIALAAIKKAQQYFDITAAIPEILNFYRDTIAQRDNVE